MSTSDQPSPEFVEAVHRALGQCYADVQVDSPLRQLAVVRQEIDSGAPSERQAVNRVVLAALSTMSANDDRDAALLRRRFFDDRSIYAVANELNVAEPTFYRMQRRAIRRLAAVLFGMEQAARSEQNLLFTQRAPLSTASQLVGVDDVLTTLQRQVLALQPGSVLLIGGLGGIGKTTVAYALAYRLLVEQPAFKDLAWISAQQQVFHPGGYALAATDPAHTAADVLDRLIAQVVPAQARPIPYTLERGLAALEQRLAALPTLVVIDNLETLADVETLVPALRRLPSPSKVVITSRKALFEEPDVQNVIVPELSRSHALHLVRLEAGLRHLEDVAAASDEELQPIYDTVGGNPLALKLVVGQLVLFPLAYVLQDMMDARGKKADELYRFIYWRSWHQLSPEAQQVLVLMPLFSQDGADLASIERISPVQGPQLVDTLSQLAHLSLISVGGDFRGKRYGIHRITETFLVREVLRWQGLEEPEP